MVYVDGFLGIRLRLRPLDDFSEFVLGVAFLLPLVFQMEKSLIILSVFIFKLAHHAQLGLLMSLSPALLDQIEHVAPVAPPALLVGADNLRLF